MKEVVIKTQHLSKSYIMGKRGQNVLKNIDLEIYKEDFTVIMGSSGSGKSTLLYALSSMDRPSGGSIELLGHEIQNATEKQLTTLRSEEIAFIFQQINLLPDLTAFENITYPAYLHLPKKEVIAYANQLIERFQLIENKDKYPSELSGGQAQRMAILRAIVSKPRIIFADEPTGALNLVARTTVLDMLTELHEGGQSIVMVTHDIKDAARGNRLLFLSDGRIEGDLNLGRYQREEQKEREKIVFEFLEAHHW